MSLPARPDSVEGHNVSDLARAHGDGDEDRGEHWRSKKPRTQERRAVQACFRCRRQKLRCPGGWPCVRCVKSNKECDFGKGNAGNSAPPPRVATVTTQQHEQQNQQERRAMQACFRCRQQKLRCLGGQPCVRCAKANRECHFGKPGQAFDSPQASANTNGKTAEDGDGLATRGASRIGDEDSRVSAANLLAGLHKPSTTGINPQSASSAAPPMTSFAGSADHPVTAPAHASASGATLLTYGLSTNGNTASINAATPASLSTSDHPMTHGLNQVRFGASPEVNYISPHSYSSRPETISPARGHDAAGPEKPKDNDEEAEKRLASATKDGFEPPFQPLVYQVRLLIRVFAKS